MPFGRILLKFDDMKKAYKFHNALNDGTAVGTEVYEWLVKQNKYEEAHGLKKSTTCCMQASMGFNATSRKIPQEGPVNRDNTKGEKTGNYYILSVVEFRAWLTYAFGPTDQVKDKSSVPDSPGVLIFGNGHIEFWDGKEVLQVRVMDGGWMWGQSPIWFWYIGYGKDKPTPSSVVPDWLLGWWTVYNGTYYYYYFYRDGNVTYIKQAPNPKWVPQLDIDNRGTVQMVEHGPEVTWKPVGKLPATVETFTRLGWTSETEMNGTSNNGYAPLFARKMQTG